MTRVGMKVKGNDYRWLGVPDLGDWTPDQLVTVVIPTYGHQEELGRTVAALEGQTYPSELYEVVVVDDGSELPITAPAFNGNLRVVRQERRGFGAPRARNRGAAEARGTLLLFLDCDMIPERTWLEAHARWLHVAEDTLVLGTRSHLEIAGIEPDDIRGAASISELLEDREASRPAWLEAHYRRTDNLTTDHNSDIFRVVTSGNLGMTRSFFEEIGGFDESFTQWGGEDTELGYRAYTAGALLVHEPLAHCWHQGAGLEPDPEEAASLKEQLAKMAHLIAHPGFRSDAPGRSFATPRITVTVETGASTGTQLAHQIESVLGSDLHDLVISVSTQSVPEGEWLNRQFHGDSRVVLDQDVEALFPFSEMRLSLPPGLEVGSKVVRRLAHAASGVGVVEVNTSHGWIRLARTRALSRAGSEAVSRWEDAGQAFGTREMRASDLQLSTSETSSLDRLPAPVQKVVGRFSRIRSWSDFVNAARWLGSGVASVLRLPSRAASPIGAMGANTGRKPPPGIFSTGAEGFERLPRLLGPRADLVYGVQEPKPSVLASIEQRGGLFLKLDDGPNPLAVPPLNPLRHNPRNWDPTATRPARKFETIPEPSPELRTYRSITVPAPKTSLDAGRLVRLAAMGVVLQTTNPDDWEPWVGAELAAAVATDTDLADSTSRELLSIRLRRAALANHSWTARRSQLRTAAGLLDIGPPTVSVVLVTNRPDYVAVGLAQIAKQTHRPIEVVLALHGFEADSSYRELLPKDMSLQIIEADATTLFGDLLNQATALTSGDFVAKMDDDDHYGPDHLTDLMLAADYSAADLVGKGAEFIYLADKDLTIRRVAGDPETPSRTIAGGAFVIKRSALRRAGGWARVKRGVDQTLFTAVLDTGGTIYRTHGFGFVLTRHNEGHTWEADDSYFEQDTIGEWDGLPAAIADL